MLETLTDAELRRMDGPRSGYAADWADEDDEPATPLFEAMGLPPVPNFLGVFDRPEPKPANNLPDVFNAILGAHFGGLK